MMRDSLPTSSSAQSSAVLSRAMHYDQPKQRRQPLESRLFMEANGNEDDAKDAAESDAAADAKTTENDGSALRRWKKRFFPAKPHDGLTSRQRLAKMGMSVALSYGWVSNVSYSITVSLAWFLFTKQTGMSPLAPGQWKGFLAVYAGFYIFNNIVRPVRVAMAVAIAPVLDRVVNKVQTQFQVRKGVAIGMTVFMLNIVGTIALMSSGIMLASLASGVPVFAK